LETSAIFIRLYYERDLIIYRRIDSAARGCEVSQFSRELSCRNNASFASRALVEKLRLCSWERASEVGVAVGIWEHIREDEGTRRCASECESISVHLHMCKVYVYMHMYIFTYMYIHICICMYVCIYEYIYIYMYTYIFMYMNAYMCVYICICMYTYIYVYVHVYMYTYM